MGFVMRVRVRALSNDTFIGCASPSVNALSHNMGNMCLVVSFLSLSFTRDDMLLSGPSATLLQHTHTYKRTHTHLLLLLLRGFNAR